MGSADSPAAGRGGIRSHQPPACARLGRGLAERVRAHTEQLLADFPWEVQLSDWNGHSWRAGGDAHHWRRLPLEVSLHSEAAGRALLSSDAMGFLEKVLAGEADLDENLYLLPRIRAHARFDLGWLAALRFALRHRTFQTPGRARASVRSHYDIPQEALDVYLDRTYRAYSCGMFERPERLDLEELLRPGRGEGDPFDSLEQAQWRKFADAVDFLAPAEGDTLLDVGCGYAGQLRVALDGTGLDGWWAGPTLPTRRAREPACWPVSVRSAGRSARETTGRTTPCTTT
jgi:hypothetical protein